MDRTAKCSPLRAQRSNPDRPDLDCFVLSLLALTPSVRRMAGKAPASSSPCDDRRAAE